MKHDIGKQAYRVQSLWNHEAGMKEHLINLMERKIYEVEMRSKKVLGFPIEF